MQEIRYSFIIPHKNTPELLERCLNSIPQRDDIEVIVVDNNSSPEIVDFEHFPCSARKDVLILRDNKSISGGGARNTGLAHANGKWVLFADADDYYSEGLSNLLDKNVAEDVEVIYFDFIIIKNGTPFLSSRIKKKLKKNVLQSADNSDLIRYKILAPWNKMVRLDFIRKQNILFEDCVAGNDIMYSFQVGIKANKIYYCTDIIYNYCIHNNSISTKKNNSSEFYICKFKHYYQCCHFYDYIGHSEWKRSVFLKFAIILKKNGFIQLVYSLWIFLMNYRDIREDESRFIDVVKKGLNEKI